ncbi:hypothetical protein GCM10018781_64250 [Kitasatospora indigofera]|uniref:Uncharacterized protein n=1 Tax=Kitasatospora indigofera TaxID=67307 RepID=A0A919GCH8_9ACTN|nr:hypothetical protein [Kitasatospora indigofera]GHH81496.1 hypothetical protein GCM10018781_64250 [Kitasatospora indigofera]
MSWDVVAADERIRWTLEPLHRVGPLWFGMTAEEAEQALDGELVPDPWGRVRPHNGSVVSREFNLPHVPTLAAVTAYFGTGRLVGAAFDARRGPQVLLDDLPLVGRVPSELVADLTAYADTRDVYLEHNHLGDLASEELGLFSSTQRADDVLLTRAMLVDSRWADRIGDYYETWGPRCPLGRPGCAPPVSGRPRPPRPGSSTVAAPGPPALPGRRHGRRSGSPAPAEDRGGGVRLDGVMNEFAHPESITSGNRKWRGSRPIRCGASTGIPST